MTRIRYDDYSQRFSVESRLESLGRHSQERVRQAETQNRSCQVRLQDRLRRSEGELHLFDLRQEREREAAVEGWRERQAYRAVLSDMARRNGTHLSWNPNLGVYGVECSKQDLQPHIEASRKKMTPSYKRQRQSEALLCKRPPMAVLDRKLDTPTLFKQVRMRSRASAAAGHGATSSSRKVGRLMLPPIEASLQLTRVGGRQGTSLDGAMMTSSDGDSGLAVRSVDFRSARERVGGVFITEKSFHE